MKTISESGKRAPLLSNYPPDANAQARKMEKKMQIMKNVSE